MTAPLNRRLAAAMHRQGAALTAWANALDGPVKCIYARCLKDILRAAESQNPAVAHRETAKCTYAALTETRDLFRREFSKRIRQSHNEAATALLAAVPLKWWAKLARTRAGTQGRVHGRLREDDEDDTADNAAYDAAYGSPPDVTDELQPIRDLTLSREEAMALIRRTVFPSLSEAQVDELLHTPGADGRTWEEWLTMFRRTRPDPEQVANELIRGIAAGENMTELRKRIAPLVENYRASANTIARTDGCRIAALGQWQAFRQLGPMIKGRQRIATIDKFSRGRLRPQRPPDDWDSHGGANGRLYLYDGRGDVAADTSYRDEKGRPFPGDSWRPNCRCKSLPILHEPEESA